MQKFLSKILISTVMIAIFLAPVSVSFQKDNKGYLALNTKINKADAAAAVTVIVGGNTAAANVTGLANTGTITFYLVDDINVVVLTDKTQQEVVANGVTDASATFYNINNGTYHVRAIGNSTVLSDPFTISTGNPPTPLGGGITDKTDPNYVEPVYGCGVSPLTWFTNCMALALYTLIFSPMAAFATFAGKILDFFVYYSTNSNSYNSAFIGTGWAAVRDIANIFFIIALLYVAIQTILDLGHGAKKMIATIVVVGLLINFSLFFTQVIIDSSNILAKVFYNQVAQTKTTAGSTLAVNPTGDVSISSAIVRQFNPEKIFIGNKWEIKDNVGMFVFVTLLAIVLMGFMVYIFLSVALLFVGRVAALWIAMIFAPIAFASYTMPFDIPGFGHKEWWSELLKNAFLAPIFIFFLYIILLFHDAFMNLGTNFSNSATGFEATFNTMMGVVIPFALIFVLLMKAKELAVDYSGKIGKSITSVGSTVGGFALGAVTGGAAVALRNTVGAHYQGVANNDELRAKAAAGDKGAQKRLARANYFAKSSFDARQTGAGKAFESKTGLNLNKGTGAMGFSTEKLKGGRAADTKRVIEKEQEKTKSYELTGDAAAKQNDRHTEYEVDKNKVEGEATTQNKRASEYETDKKEAKARMDESGGGEFNEAEFKKAYEKGGNIPILGKTVTAGSVGKKDFDEKAFKEAYNNGGDMSAHGLNKTVTAGSVGKAADVNQNRRDAYADSLVSKADKEKAQGAMKTFFNEWGKGMKKMTTTAAGLGTVAAVGVATGGLGAGAAVLGGGFLHALKETFAGGVKVTDKEVIAAVRKGETSDQKLLKLIKEGQKKAEEADHGKKGGGGGGAHAPTTVTPAHEPAHAPAATHK